MLLHVQHCVHHTETPKTSKGMPTTISHSQKHCYNSTTHGCAYHFVSWPLMCGPAPGAHRRGHPPCVTVRSALAHFLTAVRRSCVLPDGFGLPATVTLSTALRSGRAGTPLTCGVRNDTGPLCQFLCGLVAGDACWLGDGEGSR